MKFIKPIKVMKDGNGFGQNTKPQFVPELNAPPKMMHLSKTKNNMSNATDKVKNQNSEDMAKRI